MEEAIRELKKLKAKRVFVQYPEGLKTKIQNIDKQLKKEGFETVLCCEPVFGACDIRDFEAKRLDCQAVLHIAHSDFGVKSELPVVYWDYFLDVDPIPALKKNFDKLKDFKNIGLFCSIQYVPALKMVKEYLEKYGKKAYVYKSQKHEGQVLGCRVYAGKAIEDKVDCFLYVGGGKFHPLGLALITEKPVFSLDVERNDIISLEPEKKKYLQKKAWHDYKLKEAKVVGITVSWKQGQNRIEEAMRVKEKLESEGKEVHILAFDTIAKSKTIGMKFDVILNLVCPRMDDEDLLE